MGTHSHFPTDRLHNNLKALRLRQGLSQQELAKCAGVTRQTIGGGESGLYTPSTLVALRLARALGCRVEDLL
jgi:DNA-binding XRE family transcriptional regulator